MNQYNCFLFPGQGSQSIGMCSELINKNFTSEYFEKANNILEYDIKRIILEGPLEKLNETNYTQPAIFITSILADHLLKKKGIYPHTVAGHSLGEYSALVSANVINFEDALLMYLKNLHHQQFDSDGNYNQHSKTYHRSGQFYHQDNKQQNHSHQQ